VETRDTIVARIKAAETQQAAYEAAQAQVRSAGRADSTFWTARQLAVHQANLADSRRALALFDANPALSAGLIDATLSPTLAIPSAPGAFTHFVNGASGSDVNDGLSRATAWRTLEKAMATVPSGAVVGVEPGTYAPVSVFDGFGTFYALCLHREFAARTWFVATSGKVRVVSTGGDGRVLYASSAWLSKNVALSGFVFDGGGLSGVQTTGSGVVFLSNPASCHDIVLLDCEVIGASGPGNVRPCILVRTDNGGANMAAGGSGTYSWTVARTVMRDGAYPSVPIVSENVNAGAATGIAADFRFIGGSWRFANGSGPIYGDGWVFDGLDSYAPSGRALCLGIDGPDPALGTFMRCWNAVVQNCKLESDTDHGLVVGATTRYCAVDATTVNGGAFGVVFKEGRDNVGTRLTITTKVDGSALYFKGAKGCVVSDSTVDTAVGTCVKLGAGETGTTSQGNRILRNRITARGTAALFGVTAPDAANGGHAFDYNRYNRYGAASSFGTVRGAAIKTRGDLMAAWAGFDVSGNDAGSILVNAGV